MGLSMAEAEGLTRAMDGAVSPGGILCWSILRNRINELPCRAFKPLSSLRRRTPPSGQVRPVLTAGGSHGSRHSRCARLSLSCRFHNRGPSRRSPSRSSFWSHVGIPLLVRNPRIAFTRRLGATTDHWRTESEHAARLAARLTRTSLDLPAHPTARRRLSRVPRARPSPYHRRVRRSGAPIGRSEAHPSRSPRVRTGVAGRLRGPPVG